MTAVPCRPPWIAVSANGRLLITRYGSTGSDLVAIATGEVLWSSPTSWSVLAAGQGGGPLYVHSPSGELARLNVETGQVVWSRANAAVSFAEVAVDGPRVYVATFKRLDVRDAGTGDLVWSKTYASALGRPVVAGGVLYVTVDGVYVDVVNAETGGDLDPYATYDGAVGHPVIVNGWLYVTSGRLLDAYTI